MAVDKVRAMKDPEYRKSLTPEELASLPGNPGATSDVSEEDLGSIAGGTMSISDWLGASHVSGVPSSQPPTGGPATTLPGGTSGQTLGQTPK